ncbi:MAG TPA: hypothetical protein PLE45_10250 [Spirochaetota bacterium]|nr:hypothetical protein [Spirochaetota bacterium]HOL57597.1 hypothetical protein [Spirochaetota bacterium]HPP05094.1 hypothetical protein [Spirochaetota bacterium]
MKKLFVIFLGLILLFSCSNNKHKEYIKDVNFTIENIQKAINTGNRDLFNNHSRVISFFEFYSMIAMASKTLGMNKDAIVFKPIKYSGNDKSISCDVKIVYNISNINQLNLGFPKDIVENIVKMGLADKMTIVFNNENGKLIATSYKFPLRYFYMNIFISSDSNK